MDKIISNMTEAMENPMEVIDTFEKDGYILEKVRYADHVRLHLRETGLKSYSVFAASVAHLIPESEIDEIFKQIRASRTSIEDLFFSLSVEMKTRKNMKNARLKSV